VWVLLVAVLVIAVLLGVVVGIPGSVDWLRPKFGRA